MITGGWTSKATLIAVGVEGGGPVPGATSTTTLLSTCSPVIVLAVSVNSVVRSTATSMLPCGETSPTEGVIVTADAPSTDQFNFAFCPGRTRGVLAPNETIFSADDG